MPPSVWVGLAVSMASIVFLVVSVDFDELTGALSQASPLLVVAGGATLPITMYLKCLRWRYFFPQPAEVSMQGMLAALYLGYLVNTVLPLRAGEILRAYLVGESDEVSKSTVLATVLIEKVFDLGTMALLLFLLRFAIVLPVWADAMALASGAALAVAVTGLTIALTARRWALELTAGAEERLPLLRRLGAADLLRAFLDGLEFLQRPRALGLVVLWSVLLWIGSLLTVVLALAALGITPGLAVAAFVLVVTNLGMAVPSAPGYVGVFHSAVVVALTAFGVDTGQALASAVLLHVTIFGAFIVGGLYYLLRGRSATGQWPSLTELLVRARQSLGDGSAR